MPIREPRAMRTDALQVALFLLALAAPAADLLVRPDDARSVRPENRNPAPAPVLEASLESIFAFPAAFEAFHGDRFGLRDRLVRWHNAVRMLGFRTEPTSAVVLGKDGWLFFTADRSVQIWRGLDPLTADELEGWRTALEQRRDWLANLGIEFLFVVVPNKEQIYSEHVPERLNRVGPTRLDELVAYLRERSSVRFVDLRPALLAERREDRDGDHVFFPLGTHWTERGAFAATNAILERISASFPAAKPLPRESFRRELLPDTTYDSWGSILRIDDLLPQSCWLFAPVNGFRARTVESHLGDGAVGTVITEVDDPTLPRVVLVHDSFGPWLRPFLAERCSRLVGIWQHGFPKDVVWTEKPNVVIQMYTERALAWPLLPLADEAETLDRAAFERLEPLLAPIDFAEDARGIEPFAGTHVGPAIEPGAAGVLVDSSAGPGYVYLPAFDAPEDAFAVLHVELTSPAPTALQLWYATRASPELDRKRYLLGYLRGGRNDVYLKMPVKGVAGRLLLNPGIERGRYVIHRMEARSARE